MENASKALLIAAAVLIVIIIITIGIKIYTSTGDTQKVAMSTGDTISQKTGEATGLAVTEIAGEEVNDNIKYFEGETQNQKSKKELHQGDTIKISDELFMVFSVDSEGIKAMPYYNITLTTDNPVQSPSAGTTKFSSTNYWPRGEDDIYMEDDRNYIQQYIKAYEITLKNKGVKKIRVEIPRLDHSKLGTFDLRIRKMQNPGGIGSFWVGTSHSNDEYGVYKVGPKGDYGMERCGRTNGVRPIIIIK